MASASSEHAVRALGTFTFCRCGATQEGTELVPRPMRVRTPPPALISQTKSDGGRDLNTCPPSFSFTFPRQTVAPCERGPYDSFSNMPALPAAGRGVFTGAEMTEFAEARKVAA